MSRPPYSHKIVAGNRGVGGSLTYTNVVDGQVVVIRSMDAFNSMTDPQGLAGFVVAIAQASPVWGAGRSSAYAFRSYHWDGHQCLETGDSLTFTPFDNDWAFIASGYILTPS